jgi:hypothetical protein
MNKITDNTVAMFDGYALRMVTEADRAQLEDWIAADPCHAGVMKPEFFMGVEAELAPDPRATCYALEHDGHTLFYIRLTRAARVNIQFAPGRPWLNAIALVKGMAFLEVGLARAGAEEWIFNTESSQLRGLAEKHMQFVRSPHELVRAIPRPRTE